MTFLDTGATPCSAGLPTRRPSRRGFSADPPVTPLAAGSSGDEERSGVTHFGPPLVTTCHRRLSSPWRYPGC
jgi:hypothetical protein